MAIKFVSKEDADKEALIRAQEDMVTEVLYESVRNKKQSVIMRYHAKRMVRRGEGVIIEELGNTYELKKKRAASRKQAETLAKARETKAANAAKGDKGDK